MIGGVVLAAGAGRRYGGAKQLHQVGGVPMLQRVLATVSQAQLDDLVVVLGARAEQIASAVDPGKARVVCCTGWEAGQAASLRAGLEALDPDVSTALVMLGDGPQLTAEAIDRLRTAAIETPQRVLAADYGQGRSHPVALPRSVWAELPQTGEAAGRSLEWLPVDCRDLTPPGDVDYAS